MTASAFPVEMLIKRSLFLDVNQVCGGRLFFVYKIYCKYHMGECEYVNHASIFRMGAVNKHYKIFTEHQHNSCTLTKD